MKKLQYLIFCLFFFLLFIKPLYGAISNLQIESNSNVFIQSNSQSQIVGEHIQSFDSKIRINKDGTINVTEKIIYDFDGLSKHGIYRTIPLIKKNKEGKKLKLDLQIMSVTDENGGWYKYVMTGTDEVMKLKIGDANTLLIGVHTYIISYTVSGALTYFSDHDELYWNVTGNEWTVPIASAMSEVELPTGILQDKITQNCYTGIVGSIDQTCLNAKKDNVVDYKSGRRLSEGEGLTIVTGFPKGIVAVLEPRVYLTFWETIWGKITIVLLVVVAILWYIIYPIWIPIKWYLYGRDPNVGQEVTATFDPPKRSGGRFLAPEEIGGLIDEKVDYRDFSAMIVGLAQKGYLRIEEKEKKDFYFIKRKEFKNDSVLLPHQKYFLEQLFEEEDEVRVKDADLYDVVQKTSDMIYDQLISDKYFPNNPNNVRKFYSAVGIFALVTLNIGLAFTAFVFGRNMPKKTESGVEAAKVGKSLQNFLSSQERQLAFQAKNQLMFEKLLPYAIAFGVEKIWAKRFDDVKMKQPDWYRGYGGGYYSSALWMSSMNSSFSSFRSAATPTTSSSGYSSGFSGGFSGGGGGGGGGGSW